MATHNMVKLDESFARFEAQESCMEEEDDDYRTEDDASKYLVVYEVKCHEMCFGVMAAAVSEQLKRKKKAFTERLKRQSEEAYWNYQFEYSLNEMALGEDRNGTHYVSFIGAPGRVFVRTTDGSWLCVEAEQLTQLVAALTLPCEKDLARIIQYVMRYASSLSPREWPHHRTASQEAVQLLPLRARAILQQLFSTPPSQCGVCGGFITDVGSHCPRCHLDFDDSIFATHRCVEARAVSKAVQLGRQYLIQLELAVPFSAMTKRARVCWTSEKRAAWQMKGERAERR